MKLWEEFWDRIELSLPVVFLWIGLWGIVENVIDKYIPDKYEYRLLTFFGLIILAVLLHMNGIREERNKEKNADKDSEEHNLA